jgi:hypothetical protein
MYQVIEYKEVCACYRVWGRGVKLLWFFEQKDGKM